MTVLNNDLIIVCEWAQETPSGEDLQTLIGNNVMRGGYTEDFTNASGQKAISIQNQAMSLESLGVPMMDDNYLFKCFGGSTEIDDAWEVFAAVTKRFENVSGKNTTSGGIVLSHLINKSEAEDPDYRWPLIQAIFNIKTL
jgi:hypothetical protein